MRGQRANADGSGVEDLITGLDSVRGLALDASGCRIYWTESNGLELDPGQVNRANLDGTGGEVLVKGLGDFSTPGNIALDVAGGLMY